MKKLLVITLSFVLVLGLMGCGGNSESKDSPPKLYGAWKQTNSNSDDMWQEATIEGNTIEIYWISNDGDTKDLYWAGTFEAPSEPGESYSWTSENDKGKTDSALLASGDDTKEFSYENGEISYEASAFGSTTTVRMEKE